MWKLKHANSILETFEYFCQISSKLILIIFSYTVSKLVRFFETQCISDCMKPIQDIACRVFVPCGNCLRTSDDKRDRNTLTIREFVSGDPEIKMAAFVASFFRGESCAPLFVRNICCIAAWRAAAVVATTIGRCMKSGIVGNLQARNSASSLGVCMPTT